MDKASNLPMALWQANLDLQMRLGRLLQDSGREWLDLGTRAVGEGATEFETEAHRLLQAGNWQALAALPVETFWRQAEQRVGDGQALAGVALQAQQTFMQGMAEALQDWQRQVARAWSAAGLDASAAPGTAEAWNTMLAAMEKSFGGMMSAASTGTSTRKRGG